MVGSMSISTERHTLADYVAIAISPALIMALVGSLVFFLVEVLLGPHYPGQLLWILFFAVFGAVLVSRISMSTDISDRAGIYAVILGVLVWVALQVYVKYPSESRLAGFDWLVNTVLIAITWWSAHRLTRDSTLIDDNVDASGAGLLQVAGLEKDVANTPGGIDDEERKQRKRDPGGLDGWFARLKRYREHVSKRPHAPGVWVVYFSLAALPLFGIGQSLIPPEDVERRRYAFWLMGVYVASGLGLLLTTSFLNLRRYLRQRNLQMPIAMTGAWLTGGVLIIVALLTVGALIPRPSPEYALVDLGAMVGTKEREGSRNAQGRGWATKKGDAAEGSKQPGTDKSGKNAGKSTANDKAKDGAKGKKGKEDGSGGKDQGEGRGEGKGDKKQPNGEPQERDEAEEPPEAPSNPLPEAGKFLVTLLKWIVLGAVALVIAFFAGRALLRFLANFTNWARRLLDSFQGLWNRLLNWWQGQLPEAVLDTPEAAEPPPPFATFRDPFASGEAEQMSTAELVRYSYDAMEAWAHDRDSARQTGETPLEFVERLTMDFPALDAAGQELARVYVGLAYARKNPGPEQRERLRSFWRLLVDMVERPMSAGVMS
jgi:Domain of unknown function (DUF4129)